MVYHSGNKFDLAFLVINEFPLHRCFNSAEESPKLLKFAFVFTDVSGQYTVIQLTIIFPNLQYKAGDVDQDEFSNKVRNVTQMYPWHSLRFVTNHSVPQVNYYFNLFPELLACFLTQVKELFINDTHFLDIKDVSVSQR